METIQKAVRGAVCCENTVESITERVGEMVKQILFKNQISESDLVSVIFSVTTDLSALNPATALRKNDLCADVPLFCAVEPTIEGMLPKVIRVLCTWNQCKSKLQKTIPIYLYGAEKLRPDLINQEKK